ncbi:MAG TPA: hypothetical protein ENK11_03935 [Phycisphaerales bacterium]|nr:hypothetical protein [Phycisphaerales bacterium]
MALIKRSEADHFARNAVALDLGDLRREGDALIEQARARAAEIIAEAEAERARLVNGSREIGYDVGYNKGLAEGITEGQQQGMAKALESTSATLAALAESWGLAISRFEAERERMIAEARSDIVELAALFAERVTRRAVSLDASTVERQIEAVLRSVVRPTRLTIAVHPEDRAQAERALPGLMEKLALSEHAEVVGDASLDRGSCVARLAGGAVLDASITGQIDRLVEAMLPDGRRHALPEVAPSGGTSGGQQTERTAGDEPDESRGAGPGVVDGGDVGDGP